MNKEDLEERLITIETALTLQEKVVDELNQVVIEQGKTIDRLLAQHKYLLDCLSTDVVRAQSEEVPPPHY